MWSGETSTPTNFFPIFCRSRRLPAPPPLFLCLSLLRDAGRKERLERQIKTLAVKAGRQPRSTSETSCSRRFLPPPSLLMVRGKKRKGVKAIAEKKKKKAREVLMAFPPFFLSNRASSSKKGKGGRREGGASCLEFPSFFEFGEGGLVVLWSCWGGSKSGVGRVISLHHSSTSASALHTNCLLFSSSQHLLNIKTISCSPPPPENKKLKTASLSR